MFHNTSIVCPTILSFLPSRPNPNSNFNREHNALSFIKRLLPHNDQMLGFDQYYLSSYGILTSYNSYGNLNWQVQLYSLLFNVYIKFMFQIFYIVLVGYKYTYMYIIYLHYLNYI